MPSYKLGKTSRWENLNGFGVQIKVDPDGALPGSYVNLLVAKVDSVVGRGQLGDDRFEDGVWRLAAPRLEEELRQGLADQPDWTSRGSPYEIRFEEEQLWPILEREPKACSYQTQHGRDLFCEAASRDEPFAMISPRGTTWAPTSRPACAGCAIPDDRYLCAHFHHPVAYGELDNTRTIVDAVCDLGREEINQDRSKCKAGGHECWERILTVDAPSAPPVTPTALAESIDHLDTAWRLAFGKDRRLARPQNASVVAELTGECSSRESFQAKLSALDDLFKGFDIPDDLLPKGARSIPGDQAFNRMDASLKAELEEARHGELDDALKLLRRLNRVRVGQQHSGVAAEVVQHLAALGVTWPTTDYARTWQALRAHVVKAVATLTSLCRAIADA